MLKSILLPSDTCFVSELLGPQANRGRAGGYIIWEACSYRSPLFHSSARFGVVKICWTEDGPCFRNENLPGVEVHAISLTRSDQVSTSGLHRRFAVDGICFL